MNTELKFMNTPNTTPRQVAVLLRLHLDDSRCNPVALKLAEDALRSSPDPRVRNALQVSLGLSNDLESALRRCAEILDLEP